MTRLGIFLVVCAGSGEPGPSPEVDKKLQGEWWLVTTEDTKGKRIGSPSIRMILSADGKVVCRTAKVLMNSGTFKVAKEGKLQVIDFNLETGVSLGVYEFRDDELWISTDRLGRPRPDGMTPKGTGWLEQWRRVK